MTIQVSHIVAMNADRVIGVDNQLPWRLPADLKRFKALTMGKPIVMGRKTWDSIGRPLPGRDNIVVTRQADFHPEGAHRAGSPAGALELARSLAAGRGVDEVFVIGGEMLYRETLEECDRIYLTEVDVAVNGDAWYPQLDSSRWREAERECYPGNADQAPPFCYVLLLANR